MVPAASWRPLHFTPRKWKQTDGGDLAEFSEALLTVTKGFAAGQALAFTEWQQWLANSLLERRADRRRRFRRALVGLPRKNGKSLLGSALALHELLVGEPGAEVYSAAGDRQQAKIVFAEAKAQVVSSAYLSRHCKTYRDAIEVPALGAVYRVLSADAKLQQGLNPSCVIFDEVHVQRTRDLWDALTLGSGVRLEPLVVGITTAGEDLETLCGELYEYGLAVAAGDVDDDTFGFWWWGAPDGCDHTDPKVWERANPNLRLGLMSYEDMEASCRQTHELAFRRYKLNQWTRSESTWLPPGLWDRLADPSIDLVPGAETWVAVDFALKHDTIAVVVVQKHGGKHVTRCRIWDPGGAAIDVEDIEQYLLDLHVTYDLHWCGYDPAYFVRSAQRLEDQGLPMLEFPQSPARMVPACQTAYRLLVSGQVAHDGSALFKSQVEAAVARTVDTGWRLSKAKSKKKIDAAVALVMALALADEPDDQVDMASQIH